MGQDACRVVPFFNITYFLELSSSPKKGILDSSLQKGILDCIFKLIDLMNDTYLTTLASVAVHATSRYEFA